MEAVLLHPVISGYTSWLSMMNPSTADYREKRRSLPAGYRAVMKQCAPVIQHSTLAGDLMQHKVIDHILAFLHEIVVDHDAALARVGRIHMGGDDDGG